MKRQSHVFKFKIRDKYQEETITHVVKLLADDNDSFDVLLREATTRTKWFVGHTGRGYANCFILSVYYCNGATGKEHMCVNFPQFKEVD